MKVTINGQEREFPELEGSVYLNDLIEVLGLKSDRVAVEHNGAIVARSNWETAPIRAADRFEIVHFVGGGVC
ncbi:Thiazole biosynthesis protein ThiG [Acidisarcina polymorpha]|uniref:Thiazole biosynthesis protein ThiG n=1 Tax=Acidisarcina polymorpha TaxID=2211140 RepID=A0A2Z5G6Q2_9BACT|nr:sulfur carrier protein ThiS [Acidisarcina polymorpha]AXC14922.1 Thiazole biosynthesis protein ThiG [Acidisarcina polymorpha]